MERNINIDLKINSPFKEKFVADWDDVMADIKTNQTEISYIEENKKLTDENVLNISSFRSKIEERHDIVQVVIDKESQEELGFMVRKMKSDEIKKQITESKIASYDRWQSELEANSKLTVPQKIFNYLNEEIDLKKVAVDAVKTVKIGWNNFSALFVSDAKKMGSVVNNDPNSTKKVNRSLLNELYGSEVDIVKNREALLAYRKQYKEEEKRNKNPLFVFSKRMGLVRA